MVPAGVVMNYTLLLATRTLHVPGSGPLSHGVQAGCGGQNKNDCFVMSVTLNPPVTVFLVFSTELQFPGRELAPAGNDFKKKCLL